MAARRHVVRHFLVDTYDGPFADDASLKGAIMLRSVI